MLFTCFFVFAFHKPLSINDFVSLIGNKTIATTLHIVNTKKILTAKTIVSTLIAVASKNEAK